MKKLLNNVKPSPFFICLLYTGLILVQTQVVGQAIDIDGNSYNSKQIGDHEWTTRNLTVSKFRNGDPILEVKSKKEWASAAKEGTPAWCYADDNQANEEKYGKLYNWYAVNDPRGLAPEGWHIPSKDEWKQLKNYTKELQTKELNDPKKSINYYILGIKLKNDSGWGEGYNGSNELGFSALPGGSRTSSGAFGAMGIATIGEAAWWWSTTGKKKYATMTSLSKWDSEGATDYNIHVFQELSNKTGFGCSVRCIKD
jgi:uncharacterized protein (TIGR02145 family)